MTLASPSQFTPKLALDQLSAFVILGVKLFHGHSNEYDKRKTRKVFKNTSPRGHVLVDYKSISNLRLFSWPLNKCATKEKQREHKPAGTSVGRCAGLGPPSNQQAGEAQYPPVE